MKKETIIKIIISVVLISLISYTIFMVVTNNQSAKTHCEKLGYEDAYSTFEGGKFRCINHTLNPITKEYNITTTGIIRYQDVRVD